MKAIILAAGPGTRLYPLTKRIPKCLANVAGKTILERQLKLLSECGINNIVLCVGPFSKEVKALVSEKFPHIKSEFVKNDLWSSTNYIYSIWLARNRINDNIILLHGDLLLEKSLLKRLIGSKHKNCVLVKAGKPSSEKDFKAWVENGFVKKIGVEVFGKNAHFCAPIYKLSKEAMSEWMKEIRKFVKEHKKLTVYAENAFNNISDKIRLRPVFYRKEFCMEVDNFDDLKIARGFLK